jgi:hypothetical protein
MSWTVQTWSGSAWSTPATALDNPWECEPTDTATDKKVQLARGTVGRITASTTTQLSLRISWDMKTNAFRSTLRGYMTNRTILKFTDHNSNTYIGVIDSLSSPHKLVSGVAGNAVSIVLNEMEDPA